MVWNDVLNAQGFLLQFSHLKQQRVPFMRQAPVEINAGGFTVLPQKPPRFRLYVGPVFR